MFTFLKIHVNEGWQASWKESILKTRLRLEPTFLGRKQTISLTPFIAYQIRIISFAIFLRFYNYNTGILGSLLYFFYCNAMNQCSYFSPTNSFSIYFPHNLLNHSQINSKWNRCLQILTVKPLTVPISSRMVNTSKRAWVGCSPTPSPALMTGLRQCSAACCDMENSYVSTTLEYFLLKSPKETTQKSTWIQKMIPALLPAFNGVVPSGDQKNNLKLCWLLY